MSNSEQSKKDLQKTVVIKVKADEMTLQSISELKASLKKDTKHDLHLLKKHGMATA